MQVTRDTCTFREDYITYTTNIVRIHVLVLSLHIIWHDLLFVNHGDINSSQPLRSLKNVLPAL